MVLVLDKPFGTSALCCDYIWRCITMDGGCNVADRTPSGKIIKSGLRKIAFEEWQKRVPLSKL